jgi:hypothetical protein
MTYRINPAFERYPEEGNLVGFILSSFGELELTVCDCARVALRLGDYSILKVLYQLRATSSRIDTADGLMRPFYEKHGLVEDYDTAIKMLRYCLLIRNQYAHCNWADHHEAGLFFADLQTSAKNANFDHSYKHVNTTILKDQLEFFQAHVGVAKVFGSGASSQTGSSTIPRLAKTPTVRATASA